MVSTKKKLSKNNMVTEYQNLNDKNFKKVLFHVQNKNVEEDSTLNEVIETESNLIHLMVKDLCKWISDLIKVKDLKPETFFQSIQNGVILCKLANAIQTYAVKTSKQKSQNVYGKQIKFKSHEKCEKDKSLFNSRENVSKFLDWCKCHKLIYKIFLIIFSIPQSMLFESNYCVEYEKCGKKEIVICLMSLAKKFNIKYNVPAPIMVNIDIINEKNTKTTCKFKIFYNYI